MILSLLFSHTLYFFPALIPSPLNPKSTSPSHSHSPPSTSPLAPLSSGSTPFLLPSPPSLRFPLLPIHSGTPIHSVSHLYVPSFVLHHSHFLPFLFTLTSLLPVLASHPSRSLLRPTRLSVQPFPLSFPTIPILFPLIPHPFPFSLSFSLTSPLLPPPTPPPFQIWPSRASTNGHLQAKT